MRKQNILWKKIIILCLTSMIAIVSLTGCGNHTKVVFTTGLSGNQIFKIDSEICTKPEAMIYLTTFYNQYIDIYGEEIWNYDFEGVTLEEHVKEVVLSKLVQIKIMNLMAKEQKITLSAEEAEAMTEAAEDYYGRLTDTFKQEEKLTLEDARKVFEEYAIAHKVYETITESAEMEISDDEARTVTVQEIYLKNWKMADGEKILLSEEETLETLKTAKNLLIQLENGADFATLAQQYSDDKQTEKAYARESADNNFEEILFSLDAGELSGVIETKDGYHIVRCISTMDQEATQENKLVLAQQRKKTAFSEAYAKVEKNAYSEFREKFWDKIHLEETVHRTEGDFFQIYAEAVN